MELAARLPRGFSWAGPRFKAGDVADEGLDCAVSSEVIPAPWILGPGAAVCTQRPEEDIRSRIPTLEGQRADASWP